MKLYSQLPNFRLPEARILRIVGESKPGTHVQSEALIQDRVDSPSPQEFGTVLSRSPSRFAPQVPSDLIYLTEGDIIRIGTDGHVTVMYRKNSRFNAMLLTERCNSKCLMCSQPPRDVSDDYMVTDWLKAIELMSTETGELGITGGEPTLLYGRLLDIIRKAKEHLPKTSLHMLSNGRLFRYLKYAQRVAAIEHPDLMIGIPLYSDVPELHDFVVQAKGAFDETILGILNLGRLRQKIEIRFVIHRQTINRLVGFARYVGRNLPFVDHVALMGLELTGYARTNLKELWIDPMDYQAQLIEAVDQLASAGVVVSIYNHPLCLLPKSVWKYSRQSISDWKNIYFEECQNCAVKSFCGGFFASSETKRSEHIRPLGASDRQFAEAI